MDYQSLKAEVEQKTLQTLDVLRGEFAVCVQDVHRCTCWTAYACQYMVQTCH